ncbi:MAG: T9SS type A sorting domain-containing protein [Parafilimonas sp.]
MKKNLSLFITSLLLFNFSFIYAQTKHTAKAVAAKTFKINSNLFGKSPGVSACDTVNLDAAQNWHPISYGYNGDGYVFGTIDSTDFGFNFIEQANYFDVSSSDYSYISGGLVYFSFANTNTPADLNKDIIFKLYDDNGGYPGNLLASTTLKLSQVKQDVLNNDLTEFAFPTAIKMPLSKTFYISVDDSNFEWTSTVKDSISIVASQNGEASDAAYQKISIAGLDEQWIKVSDIWIDGNTGNPLEVNLFIFPYVSNAIDGCSILPVSMFNFGGTVKDQQAYLNWSTASESNNKGFYVERSKDGKNFTDIGFLKGAVNSTQIKNYTYTDATLKDINVTTTYYRLKQVDVDGKYTYSKVLPLNITNILKWRLYPNPVKDVATVELNLETASKVTVQVFSRDGKVVLTTDKGIINAGTQQVFINTQNLATGSYIVRTKVGDKTYSQMIIKE